MARSIYVDVGLSFTLGAVAVAMPAVEMVSSLIIETIENDVIKLEGNWNSSNSNFVVISA